MLYRAVVEKLAHGQPLLCGLQRSIAAALRNPTKFFVSRPFGICWALYASTYVTANGSQTVSKELDLGAADSATFASTMLVNVPLGIWKDTRFAQIFGKRQTLGHKGNLTPVRFSGTATGTFLLRDAVTIFGSFTMAPALTAAIPDSMAASNHTKYLITQMTVPVFSQLVAAPVHLLGLDFHNRQHEVSLADRFKAIKGDLLGATVIRCVRIIPAFGVGCIVNTELQSSFHRQIES